MSNLKQAAAALEEMADLLNLTEKSIASVARRFNRELKSLVSDAWNGSGTITRDMRQLVKQYVEDAYYAGLQEGGVSPDEASADDLDMIIELDLTQQDYVKDFASDVRKARNDTDLQDALLERINLWTASIEAAGMQGLASASKNEMVTWRLGSAEEHCRTCNQLNGRTHRRQWFADRNYFPGTPGAALDCHGFNCACTLE